MQLHQVLQFYHNGNADEISAGLRTKWARVLQYLELPSFGRYSRRLAVNQNVRVLREHGV
jgi:hypothetical protein